MGEFRTNLSDQNIDDILGLAFIEDPRTRRYAAEVILGRKVTPMEMAQGDVCDIITLGMKVHRDPVATVTILKALKRIEKLTRSG